MQIPILSEYPTAWRTIVKTLDDSEINPFTPFATILTALDISLTDALTYFTIDYNSARSIYAAESVSIIFDMVYNTNSKKYDKLIAAYSAVYNPINNYDMIETGYTAADHGDETQTRATDPEHNSTTTQEKYDYTSTTSADDTDLPTTKTYTTTYDSAASDRLERYMTNQGANITHTETNADNGNETTTIDDLKTTVTTSHDRQTISFDGESITADMIDRHKLKRSGNIGVTTSQQMIDSEMTLAEKMNIFKIIERDIAAKLFLAAW